MSLVIPSHTSNDPELELDLDCHSKLYPYAKSDLNLARSRTKTGLCSGSESRVGQGRVKVRETVPAWMKVSPKGKREAESD